MVNFIEIPKFVKSDDVSKANSIVSLNPTGTLTMEQTFEMNGSNNLIQPVSKISADNLKKSNTNEFNCNIENFNSSNIYKKIKTKKKYIKFIDNIINNFIFINVL